MGEFYLVYLCAVTCMGHITFSMIILFLRLTIDDQFIRFVVRRFFRLMRDLSTKSCYYYGLLCWRGSISKSEFLARFTHIFMRLA